MGELRDLLFTASFFWLASCLAARLAPGGASNQMARWSLLQVVWSINDFSIWNCIRTYNVVGSNCVLWTNSKFTHLFFKPEEERVRLRANAARVVGSPVAMGKLPLCLSSLSNRPAVPATVVPPVLSCEDVSLRYRDSLTKNKSTMVVKSLRTRRITRWSSVAAANRKPSRT